MFVTVRHHVFSGENLAIEETQDLVYRAQPGARAGGHAGPVQTVGSTPAPAAAQWSRELHPDSALLFRYSALTFNSHRIHYDRDYAVREEGYPGLVVQGPLAATLLLDLLHRELPSALVARFEFRALRPLLADMPVCLQGRRGAADIHLWVLDSTGNLAVEARAVLQQD